MPKKRANGEGNIRKRKDGRWEGRFTAGYDSNTGKRIIKNVLGRTQAEAKEKLKAAMAESQILDVSREDEYTVATWLKTWYELYAKPNVRAATADRYRLMIETYIIPRVGRIKLKKLTYRDLQKLYKDLMEKGRVNTKSEHGDPGLSGTMVRSVHLMLHCAFERAVKERLIPRNLTDDCIAPKIRKVSIPQMAIDLLIQEHEKHPGNPYMFPSPVTGEMYYPDSVVNLHKKILKDAGLEHIRFHDLRHTFATMALQNGVGIKTVSSMLGYYDAGFTLRAYTHATRQKQDEAAETMGSFMEQVM